MNVDAIALLDRLIAIHEAAFYGQPPQQVALRAYIDVKRADISTLKDLRDLLSRQAGFP